MSYTEMRASSTKHVRASRNPSLCMYNNRAHQDCSVKHFFPQEMLCSNSDIFVGTFKC